MGTISKQEDEWQLKATTAAISAAKHIVFGGEINGRALITRLSDIEWGWIVSAILFAWIQTKAEHAVAEGTAYEQKILHMQGRDPEPWETGAVTSILPGLGDLKGIDWSQPVGEWSKEQMVKFIWASHRAVDAALAARDAGAVDKVVKYNKEQQEREVSAANGGPLLSHDELTHQLELMRV